MAEKQRQSERKASVEKPRRNATETQDERWLGPMELMQVNATETQDAKELKQPHATELDR